MAKIVVEKNKLEEIRDNLTSLLQSGNKFVIPGPEPIYELYDLNEKEQLIIEYLNKNPGHFKEQVIAGCKDKYSRKPIFNTRDGLLEKGFIIKKEDHANRRTYKLYVNYQNTVLSFRKDLENFKYWYCELLDFISPYLVNLSKNENNRREYNNLVKAIIEPYKYLCIMYLTSDLLLWNTRPLDDNTLHRKFAVFFETMRQIQIQIFRLFSKVGYNPTATQLLFDSSYGFSELHLVKILETLKEYSLCDYAEPVVDILWKLSYPILPLIYPSRYEKHFKDGMLNDWRNLFKDKPESTYKPRYEMLPFDG
ncbi:MAG TPA: hypothetical protein VH500_03985 [Nitrososphaeraceae archaeon]